MNEEIQRLLDRAEESIVTAEEILAKGHSEFAVSRAYYAMFYCAEALLYSKDLGYSKHSSTIGAFAKVFIKTGELPKEMHKYLLEAFESRQEADYQVMIAFSSEQAQEIINKAKFFLEKTKGYFVDRT